MNNKGFAITGVLYSILVLFIVITTLLIFNLQNKKIILDKLKKDTLDNVENISTTEEEVCEYEVGQEFTFDYTGSEQTFTVPCSGYYQLETWGAQGGSVNLTEALNGGYGGYSVGTINQNKNTTLYIYVGGQGIGATKSGVSLDGGYNGGGNVNGSTTVNHITASGGGATHIALVSGLLSTLESYKGSLDSSNSYYISEKIILVAGGGGGARDQSNHIEAARWGSGGSGGGFKSSGAFSNNGTLTVSQVNTCLATQTTGNTFGQGATGRTHSGGGGGYFGGYSGNTDCGTYLGSGSGGSGYIGNNLLFNKHMTCYECEAAYQTNVKTVSNTNVSATATSDYSKLGNGYAKITYLGKRKNANKTKYKITNMISNGSFEDDFTDYYGKANNASISSTESAFGSKSYKRGTSTKAGGTVQYINVKEGHKYYYFLHSKSGSVTLRSDVSNTGWGAILSKSTDWNKFGIIITATTTAKKNISLNYGNDITEDTYVDGVGFVDLTEAFGAGNEPSKEWCDIHIDYFDGTKTIYK